MNEANIEAKQDFVDEHSQTAEIDRLNEMEAKLIRLENSIIQLNKRVTRLQDHKLDG